MLCLVGPLAGRERSLPGIALALLAGQFGLHLIFSLGQGSTAPLRPTVPTVRDYETRPAMHERLGQHLGHRRTGIRKTLKCAFRVAERGLRPLGLLPQPRDLFQHLLSRASSRPSTDGTSHLHERRERTYLPISPAASRSSCPPSPNQTITFGKRKASQCKVRSGRPGERGTSGLWGVSYPWCVGE